MTELELIGKQQLEIEELKKELEEINKDRHTIQMKLVGVGGPLNDNKLAFSRDQFKFLYDIYYLAGGN